MPAPHSVSRSVYSLKPFLLDTLLEWCAANRLTPILLTASHPERRVPPRIAHIRGLLAFNMAPQSIADRDLTTEGVSFLTRFSGQAAPERVALPVACWMSLRVRETGHVFALNFAEQLTGSNVSATPEHMWPDGVELLTTVLPMVHRQSDGLADSDPDNAARLIERATPFDGAPASDPAPADAPIDRSAEPARLGTVAGAAAEHGRHPALLLDSTVDAATDPHPGRSAPAAERHRSAPTGALSRAAQRWRGRAGVVAGTGANGAPPSVAAPNGNDPAGAAASEATSSEAAPGDSHSGAPDPG